MKTELLNIQLRFGRSRHQKARQKMLALNLYFPTSFFRGHHCHICIDIPYPNHGDYQFGNCRNISKASGLMEGYGFELNFIFILLIIASRLSRGGSWRQCELIHCRRRNHYIIFFMCRLLMPF